MYIVMKMKRSISFLTLFLFSLAVIAQDAAELIKQAGTMVEAKKFAEAFVLYEKALSNLGQVKVKESINFDVATVAMNAGKNEAALAYFDKAIAAAAADSSLGINVARCHQYKAMVYGKLKDLAKSLASYEKAIELTTDKPGTLYFNAAITAFNMEIYEKAVNYFDQAYMAGVKPEDALINKANAYKKLNNDSLYMETLVAGFEKFPGNKTISSRLAAIYFTEGNNLYKEGLTILNATIKKVNDKKLKPEDAEYNGEIAKVNETYAKAVEALKKSLELDPTNPNTQKLIDACKPVK
jgi:tetratricopeptide (TPR) repeat protein